MRRVYGVTAAVAACLSLAALTGVALAGNPHGTPPGQAQQGQPAQQSSNAPAQAQQQGQPAQQSSNPPGQEKKQDQAQANAAPQTNDNSTGLKPSSVTFHNTKAPASSNKTKQYGNGKTAGQIATQAGYGNAILHGPGNSQPHKVLCGGHEVDVHALKAKGNKCGSTTQSETRSNVQAQSNVHAQSNVQSNVHSNVQSNVHSNAQAPAVQSSGVAGATHTIASAPAHRRSGVLGARAIVAKKSAPRSAAPGARSGVLGATARTGTLPFTGLSLWIPAVAALGLLGSGLMLRRRASSQA